MSYQQDLRARLDRVTPISKRDGMERVSNNDIDRLIVNELSDEFNLSRYDLDESDILRAIKIESILERYESVFSRQYALKIFYSIAKAGTINAATLNELIRRPNSEYKILVDEMIMSDLVYVTQERDLALTYEGKSLAEKIGVDIYFV
jgi:molecular chaperone DnaK (HSP70)